MRTAFLDLETTGLDPKHHEILEFAALVREDGDDWAATHYFALEIDEAKASPKALEVNRYFERKDTLKGIQVSRDGGITLAARALDGALVVGNNVGFDLAFVRELLGTQVWHYQPLDLKAYAAGMSGKTVPVSTTFLAELAEVPLPEDQHTARADAQWNMHVYDALTGRIEL